MFRRLIAIGLVWGSPPAPLLAQLGAAAGWNAMNWIDGDTQATTPYWQNQLGINQTRVSCRVTIRNTPAKCVAFIRNSPTPGISQYFLYMTPNATTVLSDALQYSLSAEAVPAVVSVGVDDFFGTYETWYKQMPNAATFVNQMINNLKSADRNLKFGITLYENELDPVVNPYIDDAHLPPYIRAKFDFIHLFLHYRKNGPKFAQYVAQAKTAFPNAKIIAGVYCYDRIDYFPCAQNDPSKASCTEQEEMDGFQQALTIQMQLLKQGQVAGLELFPGHFGAENNLYGTQVGSDQLPCQNIARCVQNTVAMRDALVTAKNQFFAAAPVPTSVTPDPLANVRVFPNPWRSDHHDHMPITFSPIPAGANVKVFTVSGHLVRTVPISSGSAVWDLTNDSGEPIASGLYFFLVTAAGGQTMRNQLAVVR